MTAKDISDTCKVIRDLMRRGKLTRQQERTIMGQCKHGDINGARKGLKGLLNTNRSNI